MPEYTNDEMMSEALDVRMTTEPKAAPREAGVETPEEPPEPMTMEELDRVAAGAAAPRAPFKIAGWM